MTSQWARWRLKSPALPLFTQPFIRVQIKENIKAPPGEFPAQMASNAENVSIWWRHHDLDIIFKLLDPQNIKLDSGPNKVDSLIFQGGHFEKKSDMAAVRHPF